MNAPLKISAERTNFSLRLKETLASALGLPASPTVLAREFNFRHVGEPVTVHAARKWLVGEAMPTQDKLRTLAQWMGVSVEWLRFGGTQGNVDRAPQPDLNAGGLPLNDLVRLFLTLPHRDRMLARAFVDMLATKVRPPAVKPETQRATGASAVVVGSV